MTKISIVQVENMKNDFKTMTLKQLSEKYGISGRMIHYYCGKKEDAGTRKCLMCRKAISGRRLSNFCRRCYDINFMKIKRIVEKEKSL